jgi:hypothetical protein
MAWWYLQLIEVQRLSHTAVGHQVSSLVTG